MKLNRKWILVMSLVLSVAMAVSGTLAYMTDTDTRKNTFTLGNVDISLSEPNWTDNSVIGPGVTVAKDPTITNNGRTDAYVWLTVDVPNAIFEYIDFGTLGSGWTKDEGTKGEETTTVVFKYNANEDNNKLASNASTSAAFSNVTLSKDIPSDTFNSLDDTFDMVVNAYAIEANSSFANFEAAYNAYYSESGEPSVTYTEVATAEALSNALENGENVKLTASITTDGITIPSGKSVVVNLNGNNLTGSEYTKDDGSQSRNNVFVNNGNLTVTGSGTITTRNLINNSGAKLVINGDISIVGGVAAGGSAIWNEGDCEINGATISQTNDWNYAVQNIGTATMKITDATVSANHGAISNTSSGTLTIDGGSYTCLASGHTVYVTDGTVTINGGSFDHRQENATAEGNVVIYANNGSVVVNGGNFDSVSAAFGYNNHRSNMTITESNCTFSNSAAKWYN